jgi:molecular chaperone Hsp33
MSDTVLGFTVPDRDARGRVARLGPVLAEILSAHALPPALERVLADALILTVLVGATLRPDQGQTTIQAQAKGGVADMLVCDYKGGEIRGYLRVTDPDGAAALGNDATLAEVFGEGYLAITLDQTASAERYQGIVALEGATLCEAAARYFEDSDQIPTLIRTGIDGHSAGGILIQYLPRSEVGGERLHAADPPDWAHVRILANTITAAELTDSALPLDDVVWRLFNEDAPRVNEAIPLARGCRCSEAYIASVLAKFGEADLAEMRGEDGTVKVDCAFCSRDFHVAV